MYCDGSPYEIQYSTAQDPVSGILGIYIPALHFPSRASLGMPMCCVAGKFQAFSRKLPKVAKFINAPDLWIHGR